VNRLPAPGTLELGHATAVGGWELTQVVSSPGMRRIAAPFTVACVAASAACALVSPAPSIYVTVAEGLTSPSLTEAMQIAPRMFGPLQLADAC